MFLKEIKKNGRQDKERTENRKQTREKAIRYRDSCTEEKWKSRMVAHLPEQTGICR